MVCQDDGAKFHEPVVWLMRALNVLAVSYACFDTPRLRRATEIQGIETEPIFDETVETEQPMPSDVATTRITIDITTVLVSN